MEQKFESQIRKNNEEYSNENSKQSSLIQISSPKYASSYEKCMSMMKNGEWALLEAWLRNLNKADFDVNDVDQV